MYRQSGFLPTKASGMLGMSSLMVRTGVGGTLGAFFGVKWIKKGLHGVLGEDGVMGFRTGL